MAEIRFRTEWLTQIGLAAKCGTADDVMDICVAIQRIVQGDLVGEVSPLVELLLTPIAEAVYEDRALSQARAAAGANGGKQRVAKSSKSEANLSKGEANPSKTQANLSKTQAKPKQIEAKVKQNQANDSEEKEEEREEKEEAEREREKEKLPHTPLKEKDKEKGEEGKEEKGEEREASCAELSFGSSAPEDPQRLAVISIPLNDGTEYDVTPEMFAEFSSLYPAVDVMQELRNMRGWSITNRKNRKTRSGAPRFINAWLSRSQNKGEKTPRAAPFPQRKLTAEEVYRLPYVNPFAIEEKGHDV